VRWTVAVAAAWARGEGCGRGARGSGACGLGVVAAEEGGAGVALVESARVSLGTLGGFLREGELP